MKNFFNRHLCNFKVRLTHVAEDISNSISNRKHSGIDGLIVAIILVVIVVALLVLFRTTVLARLQGQITNMGNQLDSLGATAPAGP